MYAHTASSFSCQKTEISLLTSVKNDVNGFRVNLASIEIKRLKI